MKNFKRENHHLSLCGLNCSLCTMNLGGHCQGCGSKSCQGCSIARCSMEHENVQHCSRCQKYPCSQYDGITEYDSFIVHRNQLKDLEKLNQIGEEKYNQEQIEKRHILDYLLENYNNGRKKNFYSVSVNLLELSELQGIMTYIQSDHTFLELDQKEKINRITQLLQEMGDSRGLVLKLIKKK